MTKVAVGKAFISMFALFRYELTLEILIKQLFMIS